MLQSGEIFLPNGWNKQKNIQNEGPISLIIIYEIIYLFILIQGYKLPGLCISIIVSPIAMRIIYFIFKDFLHNKTA